MSNENGEFCFHISIGASSGGKDNQIGCCARIWAKSKTEAIQRFKEQFGDDGELETKRVCDEEVVDYLNIYINVNDEGAITEADIDFVDDEDGNEIDYITTCPKCGAREQLVVVEANGVAMHSLLEEDGFEVPDDVAAVNGKDELGLPRDFSTTDEKVECEECGEAFGLEEVMV